MKFIKFIIILFVLVAIILLGVKSSVFASTTDGVVSGYAWGENSGYINFGINTGNIHVTDSVLSGYAWDSNFGWINLSPGTSGVKNDSEGNLSGYAWGENLGWINFSGVTINSSGTFSGIASGEISGRIKFSCDKCAVTTDWRPLSVRGGGGGGGGGGGVSMQNISFSGISYPESDLVILKDTQIVETSKADSNGNFRINIQGLSIGNYIFGIYAKDIYGLQSPLIIFPIDVYAGVNIQINDIFIPPTINVDKEEVKKGEKLKIFGQSVLKSNISIFINSDNSEEILKSTKANNNGLYSFNLDTDNLELGQYFVKVKSEKDNKISSFSKSMFFQVGTKTVILNPSKCPYKGDLNNDCKVDLVDFSILIYWFNKSNPPSKVDLNFDGKASLIDFSIMAYYWTG